MICFLDIVTIGLLGNPFIFSPLPDYTHASVNLGISSVRPALFSTTPKRPDRQVAHASQSFGIGCLVCSVAESLTASRSLALILLPRKAAAISERRGRHAKYSTKNHGELITLHSSRLMFPKFTKSPSDIPVDFR